MRQLGFFILIIFVTSCTSNAQTMLETVENLDLDRYSGTWYEIARLPNSFEKNLQAVTATYSLKSNGKINVLNQGFKPNGKHKKANGLAWRPNNEIPGRLKVRFFWPFSGDYYVIKLDDNYQYALVGSPSRKYLWLLARDQIIDDEVYNEYLAFAEFKGFLIADIIKVKHSR